MNGWDQEELSIYANSELETRKPRFIKIKISAKNGKCDIEI